MGAPSGLFAELARWRSKASKRIDCTFTSEIIPDWLHAEVKAAIETVGIDAFSFLKQASDARQRVERKLRRAIAAALEKYHGKIARAVHAGREPDYQALFDELHAAIQPEVTAMMTGEALRTSSDIGIMFDPAVINTDAVRWARQYTYDLVTGLTDTTRTLVREVTATFIETPGLTIGNITELLEPAFGPVRSEMIAVTETTRAFSEAVNEVQHQVNQTGLQMIRQWHTSNDDIVCAICGPLNEQPESVWKDDFPGGPPAHPRCRCGTGLSAATEGELLAQGEAAAREREVMLRELENA
jgi:hypothetical protein